jgi:N-acetyl-alpha-D-muramate 1-phosphate uridylyltransferase
LQNAAATLNTFANPAERSLKRRSISVNQKISDPVLKAMILAAGLGTRLMPLTAGIPKALVSINGVTLLELAIGRLASEGFSEIIVNVHHHSEMVIEFLKSKRFQDVHLSISDESSQLLDTGGAILKARWFLDGNEPFLVHNVDIISNISLKALLRAHVERRSLATLSVSERQTKRYFLFDDDLRLKGWTDTSTGELRRAAETNEDTRKLAFNGIHMINPEIFRLMKEKGKFSIIDAYLGLARDHPIFGHIQPGKTWFDLGKPDQLSVVSEFLDDHPEYTKAL